MRTTTSLPQEQVALAYRRLWRVKNPFRTLKAQLDSIHHGTIHLGGTHVERTSTPTPEQGTILCALKAEPPPPTQVIVAFIDTYKEARGSSGGGTSNSNRLKSHAPIGPRRSSL